MTDIDHQKLEHCFVSDIMYLLKICHHAQCALKLCWVLNHC